MESKKDRENGKRGEEASALTPGYSGIGEGRKELDSEPQKEAVIIDIGKSSSQIYVVRSRAGIWRPVKNFI